MKMKNLIARLKSLVASGGQSATPEVLVTPDQIIRCTPTLLEVARVTDAKRPWLKLELKILMEPAAEGSDIRQYASLVMTKEEAVAEVNRFEADQLDKARRVFATMRDQLVSQVLPDSARRAARVAAAPSAARRWAARGGWMLAGAVLIIVLSLLIAGVDDGQQKVAQGATQATPGAQATGTEFDPNAPAAWNALPDDFKRTLMEAAQRATAAPDVDSAAAAIAAVTGGANPASRVDVAAALGGPTPAASKLSKEGFDVVKKAHQIRMRQGGTVYYAFVDPMCPGCQHFERSAQALDKAYSLVAIPVAFKTGSRDLAAAALCAKDKVEAWKQAARALPVGNPPCDEGYKQIDANNASFLALGLKATPTIVAPNGKLIQGSGEPEQIVGWLKSNLN